MRLKSYLITDSKYYTNNPIQFKNNLIKVYQNFKPNFVCFRDKKSKNYKELAKIFIEISREFKIEKILINSYINLAKELNFDGVHLTSNQFNKIEYAKSLNLYTICSTHTINEIRECELKKVDAISFSPIFETPNKGKPKGIDKLKKILKNSNIKIFALGGIVTKEHIQELSKTSVYGFASIRYFV